MPSPLEKDEEAKDDAAIGHVVKLSLKGLASNPRVLFFVIASLVGAGAYRETTRPKEAESPYWDEAAILAIVEKGVASSMDKRIDSMDRRVGRMEAGWNAFVTTLELRKQNIVLQAMDGETRRRSN